MKVVILAGGKGTRLTEETVMKPKPMVEIGGKPLLWHIMKIYSRHGLNDFIICCGYKGYVIKEYFANYALHMSDVSVDLSNNKLELHNNQTEPWKISLIDTGIESHTGGRLKRVANQLEGQTFCFTYGDGVSDLDVSELIKFHEQEGKQAPIDQTGQTVSRRSMWQASLLAHGI
jgi:glucose-1-phosphate cytidylyltransferase